MKTAIRRMGNSQGVLIPKLLLAELGVGPNDPVDIKVKKGKLVITPIEKPNPRAGWAEASKRLRAAGDAGLVWPEFANQGDDDRQW
jgi:antitoxin MazE